MSAMEDKNPKQMKKKQITHTHKKNTSSFSTPICKTEQLSPVEDEIIEVSTLIADRL